MSGMLKRIVFWSSVSYGVSLPLSFLVGGGLIARPVRKTSGADSVREAMHDGWDLRFLSEAMERRVRIRERETLGASVFGGDGNATVVILHVAGEARAAAVEAAYALWRGGFDVVLVDRRAHGNSDGESQALFAGESEDLKGLVDTLLQEQWTATRRIGLFGMGDAGTSCLVAASRDDRIDAVAAEDPAVHASEFIARRFSAWTHVPEPLLAAQTWCAQFGASIFAGVSRSEFDATSALAALGAPALILANQDGETAAAARHVYTSIKGDGASFVPLPPAGSDDRYSGLVEFFRRNL